MIKTKYISNNYGRKVIYPQGDAPVKRCGVLAVSPRGVNQGFWSHLRCSGQNATILAVKVYFRVYWKKLQ